MSKTTGAHRRKLPTNPATLTPEEMTQILIHLESKLSLVRKDVDRLSLTKWINSLARRVAELESHQG